VEDAQLARRSLVASARLQPIGGDGFGSPRGASALQALKDPYREHRELRMGHLLRHLGDPFAVAETDSVERVARPSTHVRCLDLRCLDYAVELGKALAAR